MGLLEQFNSMSPAGHKFPACPESSPRACTAIADSSDAFRRRSASRACAAERWTTAQSLSKHRPQGEILPRLAGVSRKFQSKVSRSWTECRHNGLIASSSNLLPSGDVGGSTALCQCCLRQSEDCSCAAVRVGVGEETGHRGDGHLISAITSFRHLGQCLNGL